jgi:hypothetical protein
MIDCKVAVLAEEWPSQLLMLSPGAMVTVSFSVARKPSLSTNVTLHALVPNTFAAGVKDSVPAIVALGGALNMVKLALLLHNTEKARPGSTSPMPAETTVAHLFLRYVPESSVMVMVRSAGATIKLGGSFAAAGAQHERFCSTGNLSGRRGIHVLRGPHRMQITLLTVHS